MKTAAIAVFAIYASQIGYAETPDATKYNNWVERVTKAATGQRPTVHHDAAAFANWSKNYPAE